MTLTIKLDGNWSSFQLAKSTPPQSVIDRAIAPSARIILYSPYPIAPPPISSHNSNTSNATIPNVTSHAATTTPLRVPWDTNASFFCWQPRGREMPLSEIMLWATPKGPPRALQTSECRELLNPTRTSCLILAQRQPGKLPIYHNSLPTPFLLMQHRAYVLRHQNQKLSKTVRSRSDCAIYKRITTVYSSPLSLH